jgi:hypothetical protein
VADYKNKIFYRNGKDIMHDGNSYLRDFEIGKDYKEGNVFLYNGSIYKALKDFIGSNESGTNGDMNTTTNKYDNLIEWAKEPNGFINPDGVVVSYNSSTRKVSLTGDIRCLWFGELVSGLDTADGTWESEAHTDIGSDTLYLKYDSNGFEWSNAVWNFSEIQIAVVFRNGFQFALRETHGLMGWQTHEELHFQLGTRKVSGGTLSSFTIGSTVETERRPNVSQCVVKDEDLRTTLPELLKTSGYTHFHLTGTNTVNLTVSQSEITALTGGYPTYNNWNGTSWTSAAIDNNRWTSIWLIAVPTTSDTSSQPYRFIWVRGQSQSTSLEAELNLSPLDVNLGAFSETIPEFVFIGQVVLNRSGGSWKIASVREITGSRKVFGSIQGAGVNASSVTYDNETSGLTATNVQTAIDELSVWTWNEF